MCLGEELARCFVSDVKGGAASTAPPSHPGPSRPSPMERSKQPLVNVTPAACLCLCFGLWSCGAGDESAARENRTQRDGAKSEAAHMDEVQEERTGSAEEALPGTGPISPTIHVATAGRGLIEGRIVTLGGRPLADVDLLLTIDILGAVRALEGGGPDAGLGFRRATCRSDADGCFEARGLVAAPYGIWTPSSCRPTATLSADPSSPPTTLVLDLTWIELRTEERESTETSCAYVSIVRAPMETDDPASPSWETGLYPRLPTRSLGHGRYRVLLQPGRSYVVAAGDMRKDGMFRDCTTMTIDVPANGTAKVFELPVPQARAPWRPILFRGINLGVLTGLPRKE